jgi:hypothetical protein
VVDAGAEGEGRALVPADVEAIGSSEAPLVPAGGPQEGDDDLPGGHGGPVQFQIGVGGAGVDLDGAVEAQ